MKVGARKEGGEKGEKSRGISKLLKSLYTEGGEEGVSIVNCRFTIERKVGVGEGERSKERDGWIKWRDKGVEPDRDVGNPRLITLG